jgi:alkanesulfonate monooxygenase SsuD/methylene tetrahydromethanopterin reductase-like flavin-dependent oxidoreductase (luciferase family)
VQEILREAGRDPASFPAANYVTLALDEDKARAEQRIDAFLENYYGQPAAAMRRRQAVSGGPADAAADWLRGYADAGVTDLIVRFTGDHDRQLEAVAGLRARLGW